MPIIGDGNDYLVAVPLPEEIDLDEFPIEDDYLVAVPLPEEVDLDEFPIEEDEDEDEDDDTFYDEDGMIEFVPLPEDLELEDDVEEETTTETEEDNEGGDQEATDTPDRVDTLPQTGHVEGSLMLLAISTLLLLLGAMIVFIKKRFNY